MSNIVYPSGTVTIFSKILPLAIVSNTSPGVCGWSKKYSPASKGRRGYRRARYRKVSALRTTPFFSIRRPTILPVAPRGTVTNTPSLGKFIYGSVSTVQNQAAAPPAASRSISKISTSARRTPEPLRPSGLYLLALMVEVVAQNQGRSQGIERRGGFAASGDSTISCFVAAPAWRPLRGGKLSLPGSGRLFEPAHLASHLFRLPTRQALVHKHHRQAELLLQADGEAFHFFGHFTASPIEAQRVPDDDPSRSVCARDLAQTLHVVAAVLALERLERLSHEAHLVRHGKAHPFPAVINGQNGALHGRRKRRGVHRGIRRHCWRPRRQSCRFLRRSHTKIIA